MPYLDIKLGSDSLLVRFVGRVDYVVGRLPKADIQLRDMSVSRLHVQFFIDSRGQAFARDLGSSGGMLVNDTPLSNDMARLHDGSRIRIGQARVVFYDAQPPVNAVDPPGKSEPRGLIRFNFRKRQILGGETVLAADKVSAQTADGGPVEAPPSINSAEFSEDGKAIEDASVRAPQKPGQPGAKPAAPVAKPQPTGPVKPGAPAPVNAKKRDTGIMTAPWEDKREFNKGKPSGKQPTVPLPPKPGQPAKPGAPVSAAQAAKDSARQKNLPPAFESTAPEEDSRKTLYEPPLPPEQRQGRVAQRPGSLGGPKPPSAPIPKQPPPPAQPVSQLREAVPPQQKPQPSQFARGDSGTKRRTLAEEMLEDYEPKSALPTVKLGQGGSAKPPSAPRIAPPPVPQPPAEEKSPVEPDLTTDEIAEYFGGERATGNLKDVKFADTDPAQRKEEGLPEEVNFGPASARLNAAAGIEDEFDLPVEPTTSQIGAVTNLDESKVGEEPVADTKPPEFLSLTVPPPSRKPEERASNKSPSSDELAAEHERKLEEVKRIAREAARSTAKIPEAAPTTPTEQVLKPAIMPGLPTEQVAKPAIMPGAPTEQVPRPAEMPKPAAEAKPPAKSAAYPVALPQREKRETKKLAKASEDPDTSKIKEFTIPITENPTQKVEGLVSGAKTLYIPKPEAIARQEERKASKPDLASMAQGPGGDTLAVSSKEMMKEIEEEYEKSKSKGNIASLQFADEVRKEPVPVDKPRVDPNKTPADSPVLPDQETVKQKPDSDEDMEFIVDDSYAFFTPPPPTRKDRKPIGDDLIDASEALPPEKKAPEPPANDKTVS